MKKMLQQYLFLICFLFSYTVSAQQIKPQVICSSGSPANQSNTKLSYTVGEITVKNISNGNHSIGQGFSHAAIADTDITTITEPDYSLLKINLYPNPTSGLLFAAISDSKLPFIMLNIYDVSGRLISSDKYAVTANNQIGLNTEHWQSGTYFLKINDLQNNPLGEYKIVKQ